MLELVNRISSTREATFIEMNRKLLQSIGITHTFFQTLCEYFVILSGNFSEDCTDEMDVIHLSHAVNVTTLESFADGLWFSFDTDKETMSLEDSMNHSPGTGKIKLVLIRRGHPMPDISF